MIVCDPKLLDIHPLAARVVLAHEVAHLTARHTLQSFSVIVITLAVAVLCAAAALTPPLPILLAVLGAAMLYAHQSRRHELEADVLGAALLGPDGLALTLAALRALPVQHVGGALRTHPSPDRRRKHLHERCSARVVTEADALAETFERSADHGAPS